MNANPYLSPTATDTTHPLQWKRVILHTLRLWVVVLAVVFAFLLLVNLSAAAFNVYLGCLTMLGIGQPTFDLWAIGNHCTSVLINLLEVAACVFVIAFTTDVLRNPK